jgi:hypothetical protein
MNLDYGVKQQNLPIKKMLSINLDRETESYLAKIITQENSSSEELAQKANLSTLADPKTSPNPSSKKRWTS